MRLGVTRRVYWLAHSWGTKIDTGKCEWEERVRDETLNVSKRRLDSLSKRRRGLRPSGSRPFPPHSRGLFWGPVGGRLWGQGLVGPSVSPYRCTSWARRLRFRGGLCFLPQDSSPGHSAHRDSAGFRDEMSADAALQCSVQPVRGLRTSRSPGPRCGQSTASIFEASARAAQR